MCFKKESRVAPMTTLSALIALVLMLNLALPESAVAVVERVRGDFTYTYGDGESLEQAKEKCKKAAMKNALESAMVHVRSEIRVSARGLSDGSIHTITAGNLNDVEIMEERINGRTVYYSLEANVDTSALENSLARAIEANVISAGRPVRIAFYRARITDTSTCSRDDTINSRPDSFIIVRDNRGNQRFWSTEGLRNESKYIQILKGNRNSTNPDFTGISFRYDFPGSDYLLVYLMDNDDAEGFMGVDKSPHDQIGPPFRLEPGQPKGRRILKTDAWELDVEIYDQ